MAETLVLPNVYAVVRNRDDARLILLQQRWKPEFDPDNSGRWELPGGKWRAFEPLADCARREIAEETGLTNIEILTEPGEHLLLEDRVQVTAGVQVVQMLAGPYPSVLLVVDAIAAGSPASSGDGSRDAQWIDAGRLGAMLESERQSFTALSFAALTERLSPSRPV